MKRFVIAVVLFSLLIGYPLMAAEIQVNAGGSVQSAVNSASNGDIVRVAAGTYNGNILIQNKSIQLLGESRNTTFLRGDGADSVVTLLDAGTSKVDGFTISGGTRSTHDEYSNRGGGFYCQGGSPTISNNIIEGNDSRYAGADADGGGGIYSGDANIQLTDNIIRNNHSGLGGGILISGGTAVVIKGNIIEGNSCHSDHGGGLALSSPNAEISNNQILNNKVDNDYGWAGGILVFSEEAKNVKMSFNTVAGNYAPSLGGGTYIDDGAEAIMDHELIYGNTSGEGGAGVYVDGLDNIGSKATLIHCTVVNNKEDDSSRRGGAGIYVQGYSQVVVKNSIFWGNLDTSTNTDDDFGVDSISSITVSYTISGEAITGTGNKTGDPLFVNSAGNDYHLKSGSPAIDAADPASDYSGEPSPNGGRADMGCYGGSASADDGTEPQDTVIKVGPGRTYKTLNEVAALLKPGNVVEVDDDATYSGDVVFTMPGTLSDKITIRGIQINGKRPVISGGANCVKFETDWPYSGPGADHYVFEGFEITGGTSRGIFHQADDLLLRDIKIHHCRNGILGADEGSGSLTMEFVEVYQCGEGDQAHQIYMATDEVNHPGSVFRMQHCYLHDGVGGNNVKSRAERNEIYYNWIEGAFYHELELIGPDGGDGGNPALKREDSDVVGNVLWTKNDFYVTRIGGDGTGETDGRYRFVNNTVICAGRAVFRIFDGIESVEMHNNVFYRPDQQGVTVTRTDDASWKNGEQIAGSNNWIPGGSSAVPSRWTDTITGTDPGFKDINNSDLRPDTGSALADAGAADISSPPGTAFPNPLFPPTLLPPLHGIKASLSASLRASDGKIDIGAFELSNYDAGDVCKDGDINLRDAVTTLKVLAGESPSVSLSADINGDRQIGLAEAIFILRYVAGLF